MLSIESLEIKTVRTCTITCTVCGWHTVSIELGTEIESVTDAINLLSRQGWAETDINIVCPICVIELADEEEETEW
jgi:hypothetical protein